MMFHTKCSQVSGARVDSQVQKVDLAQSQLLYRRTSASYFVLGPLPSSSRPYSFSMVYSWLQYVLGFTILSVYLVNAKGILNDGTLFSNFPLGAQCEVAGSNPPAFVAADREALHDFITYPDELYIGEFHHPRILPHFPAQGTYYNYGQVNRVSYSVTSRERPAKILEFEFEVWRAGSVEARKFEHTGDKHDVVRYKRVRFSLVSAITVDKSCAD